MIHLIADERHACAHAHGELTVGSRGIPVQVGLSDDFDGLAVTICFQAGTERAEVVWYEGEEINVPPQCLTKEGERLLVGVYGAKADGTVVIPTIWATAGIVKRGTDLTGVSPSDPEPDWTAQVQSIAAEAIETANSVREDADAGRFDGYSPSASVTKSGDTATITITDKDGTTAASIRDGYDTSGSVVQDGTTAIITLTDHDGTTRAEVHDGISPSASVAQTETGATVTVTDRSGTTTAQLTNGAMGPQGERGPQGPQGPQGDGGYNFVVENGSFIPVYVNSNGYSLGGGYYLILSAHSGDESLSIPSAEFQGPSWMSWSYSGGGTLTVTWLGGYQVSHATYGISATVDVGGTTRTESIPVRVMPLSDGPRGLQGPTGPTGPQGPQGETGPQGPQGADGISPTITVQPITGGHEVTVTDAGGSQSFDVMDGTTPELDAYSPAFTAGAAGGITGGGPTDSAAWTERVTGGGDASDGPANIDAIRGRTVVWNQLVESIATRANDGITTSYDASTHLFSVRNDSRTSNYSSGSNRGAVVTSAHVVSGHKYLVGGTAPTGAIITVGTGASGYASRTIFTAPSSNSIYLRITSNYDFVSVHPVGDVTTFHLCIFDLTLMFGAGNEPSTVAEFEALFPESYYPYDAGSLLPVRMEGVETTSKNLLDASQCSVKKFVDKSNGNLGSSNNWSASDYIEVISGCSYVFSGVTNGWSGAAGTAFYDANKAFISSVSSQTYILTPPANAKYMRVSFATEDVSGVQVEVGTVATPYSTHWQQTRAIPASTYFPDGMRSAGSVYDELTADAAVTRVGKWVLSSQYCTRVDVSTDYIEAVFTVPNLDYPLDAAANHFVSDFTEQTTADRIVGTKVNANTAWYWRIPTAKQSATGATLDEVKAYIDAHTLTVHYALATPTTTPINPPLNLTYRAEQGGTERITHTDPTAPPTLDVTYGSTADGIRDRVLSAIAPVENGRASVNYAVGSYLIHDGQLCKVTTAIASGEAISIGTNVTATTVMAEILSLIQ